jgi:poly-gamma-glutamate capsule biosynthesis protein CapA/YwtB (metallophosphatase superfamily)
MKKFIQIILLVFLCFSVEKAQTDTTKTVEDSEITISIVGDVMAHHTQLIYANNNNDYDFNPVFREIKKYISESDFAIANFETACAGDSLEYKGYPVFNTPDTLIGSLKDAGFDLLTTANNHLLDMGVKGAKRTMREIKKRGLFYNGSNLTQEESDSIKTYSVKGIKFAFLAYTYFSNFNNYKNQSYILNKIDSVRIKADIQKAKLTNPDLVIVYFHFGTEETREPDEIQKKIVKQTIDAGADIILGGHPHRLQPIELFKTNEASVDTGFVVYSMGNCVSNQRWRYNDAGAILNFNIQKNALTGKTTLKAITYIPTWVFKGTTERGREFIILPSEMALADSSLSYLSEDDKGKMLESYQDCIETFQKYSDKPRILNLYHEN